MYDESTATTIKIYQTAGEPFRCLCILVPSYSNGQAILHQHQPQQANLLDLLNPSFWFDICIFVKHGVLGTVHTGFWTEGIAIGC